MKRSEFEKALHEAATQASLGDLLEDDWTAERLRKDHPNLPLDKCRKILKQMVADGLAIEVKVNNPNGGGRVNAYREKN